MLRPVTGFIAPFEYINVDQADATTDGGWIPLHLDQCNGASFHNEWTALYAATIAVEGSNDPRCDQNHPDNANAAGDDITSQLTITDPAASAADDTINVGNIKFSYIRLRLSGVSTAAGTFKSYFGARS